MQSDPESHRSFPHLALVALYAVCFLVGAGAVAFACLAASREESPAEVAKRRALEDQAAIRQVLNDQDAAWNRGDLPGFMAGYWNSPELSFYSGKAKQNGWQATFDRYRARYQGEDKEMGKVRFSELDIQLLGPDTAVVRGRWQVIMSKETPEGLFTLIMKRFPEGWRIIHDHTSAG
jgi:beta-aspartyl-peptidase (threonine type)